jgi:serine-type D-Ala-D-Ala carboxypeptidase (penicillin-binding protein 5/6)
VPGLPIADRGPPAGRSRYRIEAYRSGVRWIGVLGAVVALVVTLAGPAAAAPPAGCAGQQVPPPPAAREEASRPVPAPLPWPAQPVGGQALGSCGDIGPAGVPAIGAASWVLADLDTGAVLAARAPHARHRPASTLKVLNALVVRRNLDPDTVVDGAAEDVVIDGSKAGIGPGGHYTVRELLDGLLLNSGNDAAQALARALGGDKAAVRDMSEMAHQLGALDTRPVTPSGLDGPGMASSAYDLALLFRVAMRDPLFAQTIGTETVPFPGYGTLPGFNLTNSNKLLLNYPDAIGGKAGFTDAARHTLVGAAERDGRRLVVALMRSEQEPVPVWRQAATLLDWGFAQPRGSRPVGQLVDSAPVPSAPLAAAAAPDMAGTRASADGEAVAYSLPLELIIVSVAVTIVAALLLRPRSRR